MRILATASFAGAANVLLPVLRNLQIRPDMQLRVVAERQALQIFREQGIPVEDAPSDIKSRETFLRALFQEKSPEALLLGTSRGSSIEKELLRIGQGLGIPSLSLVDHWSYYRERFLEPGSQKLRLPTRIALMDTRALERAVAEGLPREILKVTGQPHLQSLAAALRDPTLHQQAEELRNVWLQSAKGPLLLFCSELFSDNRGYTQTDALEGIAEALNLLEADHPIRSKLVVKLHPKEPGDRFYPGPVASQRGFLLAHTEPAWPCLLAADVLVGITSMMLVEAAIAGRPSVSYQPAWGTAVPFVGTETGIVRGSRTVKELAAQLSAALESARTGNGTGDSAFLREILSGDAAARITDLLLELGRESPD